MKGNFINILAVVARGFYTLISIGGHIHCSIICYKEKVFHNVHFRETHYLDFANTLEGDELTMLGKF